MPVSCENSTVQVKHSSKQAIFLMPNRMKKWVMFETMAYRWLLKYHISFPLFMVSELWKFKMSGFFIDTGETVQKRPQWSLLTLWKLGIPCQVLIYDFFRHTYLSVTHGIMLERQGRKCVFGLMRPTKCLEWVWGIKVFEMKIQIRMARTTKCKMLSMVHFCRLKQQAKSFWQLLVYACIFCSVCLEVKIWSIVCRVNTK